MTVHQSELHRQNAAYKAARERTIIRKLKSRDELEAELERAKQERDQARRDVIRMLAEVNGCKAQVGKRDEEIDRLNAKIGRMRQKPELPKVEYPSVESIVADVLARYPGITWENIICRRLKREYSEPRHACMYEVHKQRPDMSFPDIARAFHRQCHTTVMHAVRKAAGKELNL